MTEHPQGATDARRVGTEAVARTRHGHLDPTAIWYGGHPLGWPLVPLGWLYCAIAWMRRRAYQRGWLERRQLPVPVVVVGNLTVGGTGKTPAVLKLAELARARGWRPAIITRGYGGQGTRWPRRAVAADDPRLIGDEPALMVRRGLCPVVVGADRVAAAELAIAESGADLLIADDGLQHYRLARDIEILLVDGDRGLGNRRCLPAGPLREPASRLDSVDVVLTNGGRADANRSMRLVPGRAVSLADPAVTRDLAEFRGRPIVAVAAIGHPARFFGMLRDLGLDARCYAYPDHHVFSAADVATWSAGPVLMTEKDAVKCAPFATPDHWYVAVDAALDPDVVSGVFDRLEGLRHV